MATNFLNKTRRPSARGKALARLSAALFSLALTMGSLSPAAWADSAPLTQLEDHFFQHTYPADTEDDRLARLEKLVYGEAKSGDIASRVSDLQKVVAEADATPSSSNASSSSGSGSSETNTNTSNSSSSENSSSAPANTSDNAADNSADSAALAGTDYPRVDELEQLILNQTFKQLPLNKRLTQLEIKAFGKPSSDDDLSARTDALEVHWEKTLAPNLEKQYLSTVEWLENKVIGQNYSSKPLIERVQTLEGIVFPNQPPDTTTGIKEHLETLTNAVHISKNSAPDVSPMAGADQYQQQPHTYPGQPAQNQYTSQGQYTNQGQYPQTPPPYPSNYQSQAPSQSSYGGQYGQQSFQMPSAENLQPGQGYPTQSYQAQGYQAQGYQPAAQNYQQNYQQNTQQYSQSGQATENTSGTSATNEQQAAQSKGHPLLKGLAKALGAAATMAAGAMSSGMMNMNFGNGMYGNGMYGNSLYSGGYNGFNTGYGGYGGYGYGNGYGTNIRF